MTTEGSTRSTSTASPAVELRSITVAFGGLLALRDIDLVVERGDRLAVLGPNGAGKTTLFNVIAGDVHPTTGTVMVDDRNCTYSPPRLRPSLGVARTYQKTRLFSGLSVQNK